MTHAIQNAEGGRQKINLRDRNRERFHILEKGGVKGVRGGGERAIERKRERGG